MLPGTWPPCALLPTACPGALASSSADARTPPHTPLLLLALPLTLLLPMVTTAMNERAELVPPLLPMLQATIIVDTCATILAIPFSLPCARLGWLAHNRSAAASSRVAMAAMAKL
jgi:hypothetical protein